MGGWGVDSESAGLAVAGDAEPGGRLRQKRLPPKRDSSAGNDERGSATREPLPLDNLEKEETFGRLRELLAEMPKADREILTLRYALDYDTETIAETLDVNASAVHMRLSRSAAAVGGSPLRPNGINHAP